MDALRISSLSAVLIYLSLYILCTPPADAAYTNNVGDNQTPYAGGGRSLGNKATGDFRGYQDVYSSGDARTFATNVMCTNGQGWPRISEGIVVSNQHTPGYTPRVSVQEYLGRSGGRYISYSGQWVPRSHGPSPGRQPSGGLQSGAYIWLNDPWRYHSGGNPIWPFSVEINIWNTHTGGPPSDVSYLSDYYDGSDVYTVSHRKHPVGFEAFYFNKKGSPKADMVINIKALLEHLLGQSNKLNRGQHLISVDVAAECINSGDGKFIADINTMGRP